jgi:Zn-dependent M28 family amino/carboxypeptidase
MRCAVALLGGPVVPWAVMTTPADNDRAAALAVSQEALTEHVHRLACEIGEHNLWRPAALAQAAEYVEATWRGQGYQVARQCYEVRGISSANLEIEVPGRARPGEILLIGAHYDTVPGSPGANDNGSGVAALLELSRLFAKVTPEISLRFVAFVNEEPPFFMTGDQGSMVYAKDARARGDDIRLMVGLETIGYYSDRPGSQHYPPPFGLIYPDAGNFLALVSNLRSRRVMRAFVRAFRARSDFPLEHVATFGFVPGVTWSDHRSFWKQGYRAFMATDTAPYRYPDYHGRGDRPDKLNYPAFARATEGLWRSFRAVATEGLAGW